jgi:hypothetical protein
VVVVATGLADMFRPVRAVVVTVALAHLALIAGWIALRNGGVPFIRGLDHTSRSGIPTGSRPASPSWSWSPRSDCGVDLAAR